ncbi:MAG: Crp/Fnr family transcriptional regulator [Deltaproteobacteria bacterium]|nr:MAG: Crp/Fnr family transcriptional regulator [Deltaproteobacteria bacterium]
MVSREDLKSILVLRYLTDEMLDKIIPIVDILHFDEREVIFKEGDKGIQFYLLKRGKVVLEKRISDKLSFSAGSVKPGYSFGWSAMLEEGNYTLNAIAAEPCEVYSIKGEKIKKILNDDHTMGYIMNQGLLRVLKRRLDHRTEQFIRVLTQHPDIKSLNDE